ncbi:MAG TPA: LLM class flavin-dependent oxidoreductase [Thermomicrobiales bacterium]|nr:LLM class flavin-dependent oxidoreductase [Thermomicrobiales bacterium]
MPQTVRFGLRLSQHHRSWSQIREGFVAADEWGLESAWVFDHMIPLSDPRTGPNLEGWTLLAGLAEATKKVMLGTMVTGITYRNPALLLKEAVTVDHISNGRALLGVGAAWFEGEHHMFGFDYPRDGERVTMFKEALEVFDKLMTQDVSTYEGKHYQLRDAIFEPKPVQQQDGKPHIPVVIGGSKDRMLRIIARHADQWDNNFSNDDEYRERLGKIEAECARIGRDPRQMRRSTTLAADFATGKREQEQRQRLDELRALGITDFLFHAPANVEDIRPFVETVIPELRQAWA